MKIGQCINAIPQDIDSNKFNYWIGISLGNRFFAKENIRKYIEWTLLHTNNSVFVLVADSIHSINLEILDGHKNQAALRKALRFGDAKIAEIENVIQSFPIEKAHKIKVGRWSDIENNEVHKKRVRIFFEEFGKKESFHKRVVDIVKDSFKNNPKNIVQADVDKLAEYVLNELPPFIDGLHAFECLYDAIIYPSIGPIDILVKDIQEGLVFPWLTKNLEVKSPAAIIELC